MIYAISDLHGCPPEQFFALLKKAEFSDGDFLFVLGDVIDRGEHGITLLRWMAEQPNVHMLLGNHEAMMLSCEFLFQQITEETLADLDAEKLAMYHTWLENGGEDTITQFHALMKQDPEVAMGLLDYLHEAPLYELLEVNGRKILLVHGGLENFAPDKPLDDYEPDDFLWARPRWDTRYYEDILTVFGHTPTIAFGLENRRRALRRPTWICIDAGVSAGFAPMLLRLDDLKEFYL